MRYLPLTSEDRTSMLRRIGAPDIDALFADVPADKLLQELPDLPRRKSELEVERTLSRMAARNVAAGSVPFFVGAGAYRHHVPASVDHLIQRSEFLTSYTPYQPEIAQGTLQMLFEFQTQVANLTGMEVANSSMYDGSTGCAEAVLMAHRITRRKKAVLSGGLHPHYAEVVRTLSRMAGDDVMTMAPDVLAGEDMLARVPGVEVLNQTFFNEFTIRVKGDAGQLVEKLAAQGVLAGVPMSRLLPRAGLDDLLLIASTETNTDEDRAALVAALSSQLAH